MTSSLVVLKFGSSVLRTAADLPVAVDEVYREWRAGRRVIAVVSAYEGVTDQRFAQARAASADLFEQAAYVAKGEEESGTQLTAALQSNGVSARYVDAHEAGLCAHGEPHESTPAALNVQKLLAELRDHAVLVVPGFIARDLQARTVLLGRGGSDLSALFLAQRLGARCRLLKDVDGVYESDPALGAARRYRQLSWRTALDVGGKIVQARAVQFAQAHEVSFDVAAIGTDFGTCVGHGPDELAETTSAVSAPLKVALLGLGTVGLGVYLQLARRPDLFDVRRIVVRDLDKPRRIDDQRSLNIPRDVLSNDIWSALTDPVDLVIETIGGIEPVAAVVHAALSRGRAVVTANKALIASHWWSKLARYASGECPRLRFSAAVGGAVPVLETVASLARRQGVVRVRGIVNGTCNYILDALERLDSFDAALAEAQTLGLAEADPSDDLTGADSGRKLKLIARAAFGHEADTEVQVGGIAGVSAQRVVAARHVGRCLRLVATCERLNGHIAGDVRLHELAQDEFLAAARGEDNRIEIETRSGEVIRLSGKGAGRWPTALAVLGDVYECIRDRDAQAAADEDAAASAVG
jgi:homoserine dehydrogenase